MNNLPLLDASIPVSITPRSARLRGATLARMLHDAGVLDDSTLPEHVGRDPWQVSQVALTAWLNCRLKGLRCFHPKFVFAIEEEQGAGASETVGLVTWYSRSDTWYIGEALEAIEATCPRVGRSILHALESVSWRTLPLFTPNEAIGCSSHIYWYGEQDEKMALDEHCGDDQEQREEMRESMITLDAFEAAYPTWALHWQQPLRPLKPRALRRLAATLPNGPLRELHELAASLLALSLPERPGLDDDGLNGEFCGYAGALCWRADDCMTLRIADDLLQMIYETGEGYEHCGQVRIRIDDAGDMRAWTSRMTVWFRAVHLLDQLIFALSEGDWSQSKGKGA